MSSKTKPTRKGKPKRRTKLQGKAGLTGSRPRRLANTDYKIDELCWDIMEGSSDCVKIISLDGRILSMSRCGRDRCQITRDDQYVNVRWPDFWDEPKASECERAMQEAIKTGKSRFVACINSLVTKEPRWWDAVITPMRNPDGEIKNLLVISREITEKVLKEKAQRERALAEAANRAKSTLLARVSHEIRTPLTAIIGFTELLLESGLDEQSSRKLGLVDQNARNLLAIINEILELSRIESGAISYTIEEVSPEKEIHQVLKSLEVAASAKGLDVSLTFHGNSPDRIQTDPLRFRQILMNVIQNAIKYTDSGSIIVAVRCEKKKGGALEIRVTDSGAGIEPDVQSKLFQPFFSSRPNGRSTHVGTGLGLVLAREMARGLGGDVVLEDSAVGKGSRFKISIGTEGPTWASREKGLQPNREPRQRTDESTGGRKNGSKKSLEGMNILVAEDTPDTAELIALLLKAEGARVEIAIDGGSAFNLATTGDFDLILMDIEIPGTNGWKVADTLRGGGYTGSIVAFTAHAMKDQLEVFLKGGFDDYLTKPIDRTELVEKAIRYGVAKRAGSQPSSIPS